MGMTAVDFACASPSGDETALMLVGALAELDPGVHADGVKSILEYNISV